MQTHKAIPHTGLIVTTDLGNVKDIHPRRKQEVGDRLAIWALAGVYGQHGLVYSGPLYREMKREGSKIRLEFDHTGSGLMASDGKPLSHFTLAGEDQTFHPAEARIEGTSIVVSSESVSNPQAVRFGCRDDAQPNLVNREGLPAMAFRTDSWRRVTDPVPCSPQTIVIQRGGGHGYSACAYFFGRELTSFEIAAVDGRFAKARSRIDGQGVLVASPAVDRPAAVRYAWADNPEGCNLYNAAGLPASPFRTDDWPGLTRDRR